MLRHVLADSLIEPQGGTEPSTRGVRENIGDAGDNQRKHLTVGRQQLAPEAEEIRIIEDMRLRVGQCCFCPQVGVGEIAIEIASKELGRALQCFKSNQRISISVMGSIKI